VSERLPVVAIARAAAAIANARGNRRGAPDVANVLEVLPQKLFDEVMGDGRAALEAVGFADILACLKEAVASWDLLDQDADAEPEDGDPLAEWKAAIAKAEGR